MVPQPPYRNSRSPVSMTALQSSSLACVLLRRNCYGYHRARRTMNKPPAGLRLRAGIVLDWRCGCNLELDSDIVARCVFLAKLAAESKSYAHRSARVDHVTKVSPVLWRPHIVVRSRSSKFRTFRHRDLRFGSIIRAPLVPKKCI